MATPEADECRLFTHYPNRFKIVVCYSIIACRCIFRQRLNLHWISQKLEILMPSCPPPAPGWNHRFFENQLTVRQKIFYSIQNKLKHTVRYCLAEQENVGWSKHGQIKEGCCCYHGYCCCSFCCCCLFACLSVLYVLFLFAFLSFFFFFFFQFHIYIKYPNVTVGWFQYFSTNDTNFLIADDDTYEAKAAVWKNVQGNLKSNHC